MRKITPAAYLRRESPGAASGGRFRYTPELRSWGGSPSDGRKSGAYRSKRRARGPLLRGLAYGYMYMYMYMYMYTRRSLSKLDTTVSSILRIFFSLSSLFLLVFIFSARFLDHTCAGVPCKLYIDENASTLDTRLATGRPPHEPLTSGARDVRRPAPRTAHPGGTRARPPALDRTPHTRARTETHHVPSFSFSRSRRA